MQFITIWDYILLPIYLMLIRWIALAIRKRYYPPGHPWRPYFIPGLIIKVSGAIFISLVYQYYYGYGDTTGYFNHAQIINSSFIESPFKWLMLLFHRASVYDSDYIEYTSLLFWYDSASNYMVCSAAALVGIFCFTKYLCISVIMGAISFTGQWALFRTFAKQYPHLVRYIAICCLMIPSVAIWGSGIFKDTLCLFSLGWLTYSAFQVLIARNFSLRNLAILASTITIIGITKVYILVSFLPSIAIWVSLTYSYKIRAGFFRALFTPLIVGGVIAGVLYISSTQGDLLGAYTADQFLERSAITRDYIFSSSDETGSAYTLGQIDPTIQGIAKKIPAGINVTLFRPYLWEARKPIVFLNAVESLIFLLLTLKVLFTVGLGGIWRAVRKEPTIQFCLIFTLIFAFAIGVSTYNFGSLSRYRIPCLPMFMLALGLIFYNKFSPEERKFLPVGE